MTAIADNAIYASHALAPPLVVHDVAMADPRRAP